MKTNTKHEPSFLFYDLETSGLNKCFDQVMQFAAIRTDLNFKELERHEIFVKLNSDVVPAPGAIITHRISPKQCEQGIPELAAIEKIHEIINTPGTISIGYNTLAFDDEFLRFSFYRNLLPPYTHQFANQCSRADLYPMTVMYYLFCQNALNWPEKDGKPSLKLDLINSLNDQISGQAHNAIVDVEATLALAKRLHQHEDMWNYLFGYFNKATDIQRLTKLTTAIETNNQSYKEALLINGSIGSKNLYQLPVLSLGQHAHYSNQTLWLRLDSEKLQQCTTDTIAEHSFAYRKKMGETPFILPTLERFMSRLDSSRLEIAEANKQWLQDNPDLLQAIADHHRHYKYPKVPNLDIDAALYELDFPTNREEFLFQRFHLATPEEKATVASQFPNPIRKEQAIRIIGRNYPELLPSQDKIIFDEYLANLCNPEQFKPALDYRNEAKLMPWQAIEEIESLRDSGELDTEQLQLLDELQQYLANHFKQRENVTR